MWVTSGWFLAMQARLHPTPWELSSAELDAQAKCIDRRLQMGEDELLVMLIPEGTLFCNSLFGFALVSKAMKYERGHPERLRSVEKIKWLLARCQKLSMRHPFDLNNEVKPKGGIILAGHINLLRAGYLYLGGDEASIRQDYDKESQKIFDAFMESKTGFPECYSGYTWAQDSVFALESLRLHDLLTGTKYSAAIEKWTKAAREHIDKSSGAMVAQVDPVSGASVEGARGCALAWGLVFLPAFDTQFGSEQYTLFKNDWIVPFFGCAGAYEFFRGVSSPTVFHAGPVVLGLGMAASGLGIVAARSNHDFDSYNRLLRSLEFMGLPVTTPCGEKSYFLGTCLLADVVSLWGKTVVRWDQVPSGESSTGDDSNSKSGVFDDYLLCIALVGLICSAAIAILGLRLWQLLLSKETVSSGWRIATICGVVVQLLLVGVFFFVPYLSWVQIVIFMTIVDMLEELSIRPSIMGKLYRESS